MRRPQSLPKKTNFFLWDFLYEVFLRSPSSLFKTVRPVSFENIATRYSLGRFLSGIKWWLNLPWVDQELIFSGKKKSEKYEKVSIRDRTALLQGELGLYWDNTWFSMKTLLVVFYKKIICSLMREIMDIYWENQLTSNGRTNLPLMERETVLKKAYEFFGKTSSLFPWQYLDFPGSFQAEHPHPSFLATGIVLSCVILY